jgi:hypothetical protein
VVRGRLAVVRIKGCQTGRLNVFAKMTVKQVGAIGTSSE